MDREPEQGTLEHFEWVQRQQKVEESRLASGQSRTHRTGVARRSRAHNASLDLRRQPLVTPFASLQPEVVDWIWPTYVPSGKLTILAGDPAAGKTFLALNLAARISRGEALPGEERTDRRPANVVYLGGEDGLADTVRVRLDAMRADVDRILALEGWRAMSTDGAETEGQVSLGDADILDQVLTEYRPALVIVDPVQAYLGSAVDMHRANQTRPVMASLAGLAEQHRCAVLLVAHLSKGSKDRAIYRPLGSIDLAAAARSVLLVATHPRDETLRVIVPVKSSLSAAGPSLGFRLEGGQFEWAGAVEIDADTLLAPRQPSNGRERRIEAARFLQRLLSQGPTPVEQLRKAASKAGLGWRTVERAKTDLGVSALRESNGNGGTGRWLWDLAENQATPLGAHDEGESTDGRAATVWKEQSLSCGGVAALRTAEPVGVVAQDRKAATETPDVSVGPSASTSALGSPFDWSDGEVLTQLDIIESRIEVSKGVDEQGNWLS